MKTLLLTIVAHWIVVQYIVEAEITRPLREWVAGTKKVCYSDSWREVEAPCTPGEDRYRIVSRRPKLKYLVTCRMCSGFWVAVAFGLALRLSPLDTLAIAGLSHWLFIAQRIAERKAR